MAPTPPKTAQKAAAEVQYVTWDQFVEDTTAEIKPYRMLLPGDEEPTVIPCPTGQQLEAFGLASQSMDDAAAAVALFGEDLAPRILTLTASLPFTVRARLYSKVMEHYGMQMGQLPQS